MSAQQSIIRGIALYPISDPGLEVDFDFLNEYMRCADEFKITRGDFGGGGLVHSVGNPVDTSFVVFMGKLDSLEPEKFYTLEKMSPSLLMRINECKVSCFS